MRTSEHMGYIAAAFPFGKRKPNSKTESDRKAYSYTIISKLEIDMHKRRQVP